MKNLFLFLFTLVTVINTLNAQTADELAIRQVIEGESKAYHHEAVRATFLNYWHIIPESRMVYTGPEGGSMLTGADMEKARSSGQFPPPDYVVNEYTNVVIRADGRIAWASLDQKSTAPDGKITYMHEFRCLEKIGQAWKIISSSVHRYEPK